MSSLQSRGIALISKQRRAVLADDATYERGSISIALRVTVSAPETLLDEAGLPVESERVDVFIATEDLVHEGSPIEPERGDLIRVQHTTGTAVYAVMPEAGGGVSTPTSPCRTELRVHAKRTNAT